MAAPGRRAVACRPGFALTANPSAMPSREGAAPRHISSSTCSIPSDVRSCELPCGAPRPGSFSGSSRNPRSAPRPPPRRDRARAGTSPAATVRCVRQIPENNEEIRHSGSEERIDWGNLAERKGFEPSIRSPVYSLSRGAPSTTRPPLQLRGLPVVARACKGVGEKTREESQSRPKWAAVGYGSTGIDVPARRAARTGRGSVRL